MPASHDGLVELIRREGLRDSRLIEAIATVDRADYVPPEARREAYRDRPVVLPENQTTSQPSLIARMVDAAEIPEDGLVLEVGTGYGYQTALLARLARRVVSIERFRVLAEAARANLDRAGIDNVKVVVGDGWQGYPEEALFDSIVVSAAAARLPEQLIAQLKEEGRLVIPLQGPGGDDVYVYTNRSGLPVRLRLLTPARFVPLVPGVPP